MVHGSLLEAGPSCGLVLCMDDDQNIDDCKQAHGVIGTRHDSSRHTWETRRDEALRQDLVLFNQAGSKMLSTASHCPVHGPTTSTPPTEVCRSVSS